MTSLHRDGQDHHPAVGDNLLPARAPRVREAALLHADGARDGEGVGGAPRAAGREGGGCGIIPFLGWLLLHLVTPRYKPLL